MKTLRNVAIFTIIVFSFVFPQKKDLTLKQITLKGYTLYPKGLSQLKWRFGTDNFTYVDKVDKKYALIQEGTKSNKKETILILDDINSSLDNAGYEKLEKFPRFTWQDKNIFRFWQKINLFLYDLKSKKIERLNTIKEKGKNKDLSVNNDVAFIVLLAGPGLPGSDIITLQRELIARANGETEKNIEIGTDFNKKVFNEINTQTNDAELKDTLDKMYSEFYDGLSKGEKEKTGSKKSFMLRSKTLLTPWFRYFLKYDSRPTLEKVKCPVLALNGEKDLQVPAKEDLREIEKALKKGEIKISKLLNFPV